MRRRDLESFIISAMKRDKELYKKFLKFAEPTFENPEFGGSPVDLLVPFMVELMNDKGKR